MTCVCNVGNVQHLTRILQVMMLDFLATLAESAYPNVPFNEQSRKSVVRHLVQHAIHDKSIVFDPKHPNTTRFEIRKRQKSPVLSDHLFRYLYKHIDRSIIIPMTFLDHIERATASDENTYTSNTSQRVTRSAPRRFTMKELETIARRARVGTTKRVRKTKAELYSDIRRKRPHLLK